MRHRDVRYSVLTCQLKYIQHRHRKIQTKRIIDKFEPVLSIKRSHTLSRQIVQTSSQCHIYRTAYFECIPLVFKLYFAFVFICFIFGRGLIINIMYFKFFNFFLLPYIKSNCKARNVATNMINFKKVY